MMNLNNMECKRVDVKAGKNDRLRYVVFIDGTYEVANNARWEYLIGIKNYRNQIFTYQFVDNKSNIKAA